MRQAKKQQIPFIVKAGLFCFSIYAAISLIHTQLQISIKQQQLDALSAQIQSRQIENDALRQSVKEGASDEYIASVAREKLGYGYPGERKFVDASSK